MKIGDTIHNVSGQCEDLPQCEGITIDYSYYSFPLRPHGTIATYNCTVGSMLNETQRKICENGVWNIMNPDVVCQPICGEMLHDFRHSIMSAGTRIYTDYDIYHG